MLGKILSGVVKTVTIPLDVLDVGIDLMTGGDGTKRSRKKLAKSVPLPSTIRNEVCKILEEIDGEGGE